MKRLALLLCFVINVIGFGADAEGGGAIVPPIEHAATLKECGAAISPSRRRCCRRAPGRS